jgi:hypothetical protein
MFIPDPDLGSKNPDPTTAPKEEGEQSFFPLPFFVATIIIKM